jgi:ribosomal protein L16 Arg81 hydroxylase
MISTFQELIAPLGQSEFLSLLHNRTLTFRPGSGTNRYAGLLEWDTVRSLIERGVIPHDKFRVTWNRRLVNAHLYLQHGKVNADNFARLIGQGVSVVTNPVESYIPSMDALCKDIAAQVGEKTVADVIMTAGRGGALKLHYDLFDLIVLQLAGSKRWKIYGPPVTDPVKGMPKQEPPQTEPLFDRELQVGDFLFMPAGFWHLCENGPGFSLHVAILMKPPTGWHAVKALLPELLREELFRIRLTRFGTPAEKAVYEAALKARLIEKIEQMSISELAAAEDTKAIKHTADDPTAEALEG